MKRNIPILIGLIVLMAAIPRLHAQLSETHTFNNVNLAVPDGNAVGAANFQTIASEIVDLSTIKVSINVEGEFNGDLYGYVSHSSGFTLLLNRPGRTAADSAGYPDAGLDVTFQDGAGNGDIHTYQGVVTPSAGSPVTGIWEPDGRLVDPGVVLDTSSRTSDFTSFNGLDADGEWVLYLADLESGGTNMLKSWEIEITGIGSPVVTWIDPADIIYGITLDATQLNAIADVPGTFAYSPDTGTLLDAGNGQTLSVTFTPTDLAAYQVVMTNVTINVLPKDLMITADDESKVFGEAVPTLTATYSGFVNGDDETILDTAISLGTVAIATSDVGTYDITATGAADVNYTITHEDGTLTINPALTEGVVSSSVNPSLPGQEVTFTFVATAVAPGAGVPTGAVQFLIDGAPSGTPVTLVAGSASIATSSLAVGLHTVTAQYPDDGNFIGTTSALSPDQLVNTPPVAAEDIIERYPTNGVKISLSTMLSNDTDADGDTVSIDTVSVTSANGGTVEVRGNWVFYTPAPGFTGADSFTYSVSDGRGDPVTGTVTINIRVDVGPSENLTIEDLGDGSFRLRFRGIPGRNYSIEYTENLETPTWLNLDSSTADATGQYEYIDTPGMGAPTRYYRSVTP